MDKFNELEGRRKKPSIGLYTRKIEDPPESFHDVKEYIKEAQASLGFFLDQQLQGFEHKMSTADKIDSIQKNLRDAQMNTQYYIECMRGSLILGVTALALGGMGFYFGQRMIANQARVLYPMKYNILVSAIAASGLSFTILRQGSISCQETINAKLQKKGELLYKKMIEK